MSSLHDFATWEPLLRLIRAANGQTLAAPGGHVVGQIGPRWWSVPLGWENPRPGRALRAEDMQDQFDAVQHVLSALPQDRTDGVAFMVEISPTGATALHLFDPNPAVEPGIGSRHPGSLLLVEGAVPEPWRRLPEPVPGAVRDPGADPAALERTLRERIPDAVGATEAEIAATEARLGVALPDELRALYRVACGRWEDWDGAYEVAGRVYEAIGFELLPLDDVYVADIASRPCQWRFAAKEAVVSPPGAAVQGLVGSPGWIAFGDNGGGDRIAVDLTPGPGGHVGQIIMLSHEDNIGAGLIADSLTDLVLDRRRKARGGRRADEPSPVAHVNHASLTSVEAAAHPGLEVLSLGVWDGEPFGLAPVVGLPRLRTLCAYPGTLADPLEIARLTGLEYLELAPEDWRVLLDASAVPRSLAAASIEARGDRHHPLAVESLANELLALWDRPPLTRTVVEGDLGPVTG